MIWNIIRRLSLLHRPGFVEMALMLASGFWIVFNVKFEDPTPYTGILTTLMAVGASVMASLVYWALGVSCYGIRVLWALLCLLVHAIRIKLGKVGAL